MGDFNINLLHTDSHRNTGLFFDNMLTNSFFPYITQPTRFTGKTHTLIDNIFYNDISHECISGNLIPHITDHLPNFLMIPTIRKKTLKRRRLKRDFSKFNILEFRKDLVNMNITEKIKNIPDTNKRYDFFHHSLNLLFEMHVPLKLSSKKDTKKQEKPWISENILKKKKYKSYLYGEFMKTKCPEVEKEYHFARQEIIKETRKNKFLYLKTKFINCGTNIKKFWENLNIFFGRQKKISYPNNMVYKNKNVAGDFEIAETFNKHFSEVAPNLINKLPKNSNNPTKTTPENQSSFLFQKTSRYEILTHLNKLDKNKAKDLYNFPIDIVKASADLLAEPLSETINHSIQQGVFPETLKHAKVLPLFKNGPREDIKNYRPISILPLFDKIFEKVMHKRLVKFLEKNKYLNINQHGFQQGKSTSSAVLQLSRYIRRSLKDCGRCRLTLLKTMLIDV